MDQFDLEMPILSFGNASTHLPWTLRNAVEGVQIFGSVGSGKTSSSGKTLAINYLNAGFGGIVLTVKNDEAAAWRTYCEMTNRSQDLIMVEAEGKYYFDFLKYLSDSNNKGSSITGNILETLKTVIRASEEKSGGRSDDQFWENSLDLMLYHVLDLCSIAYGEVGVELLYDIVQSMPKQGESSKQVNNAGAFEKAFRRAKKNVKEEIDAWNIKLTPKQKLDLADNEAFTKASEQAVPKARLLRFLDIFFFETFKELSPKTRSIIDFTFSNFLFRLLRDPVHHIFCSGRINFVPEDCLAGKIIVINIPVKEYNKVGRDCQILFKYIFQVAMERRDILKNNRPCFLWSDEAQEFLHEHDSTFQATARSSRVCTVYITQNMPNYMASLGGDTAKDRIKSFLATLNTKIFHANNDVDTNAWASQLIGDADFFDPSRTISMGEKYSQSDSVKLTTEKRIKPENFVRLLTGGKRNDYKSEAYIHVQGDPLFNNENFKKVKFSQL